MSLSWSELLVVGAVALVVIGPKDLPGMFREMGRFTAKVRAMGREFSRAMEQAAKESGVQDVADDLRKVANPKSIGLDAVKNAADKFEKWDPLKNAAKPTIPAKPLTPAPMPATPAPAAPVAAAPVAAAPVATAPIGPNTAALYEKQAAAKAAAAAKTAEKLAVKANEEVAVATAEPVKKAGRVRKKVDKTGGEPA